MKPVIVTRGNWRWAREKAAHQLAKFLRKGHRTTSQVAAHMKCSFMVARRRIQLLGQQWKLQEIEVRQGDRGPTAKAFKIVKKLSTRPVAAKRVSKKRKSSRR
jgi:hypothetical protein